jgi:dGTPase
MGRLDSTFMTNNVAPSIWSEARQPRPGTQIDPPEQIPVADGTRSVFQQDYDRLLFSTPVRRLADKTQVWPMDQNDGVRSRLTHSHEVANLARSIGTKVYAKAQKHFVDPNGEVASLHDVIQPLLQAIGLGHDLGNPPFGHQGEAAIGNWFKRQKSEIFQPARQAGAAPSEPVPEEYWAEFFEFDGNPQSLRLLTKLQTHIDGVGLDLSAATLAASLKYPVSFKNRDKKKDAIKKGGYFESERDVVEWIRDSTGLQERQRHPLTWIMEACDDIAYSILDIDDVLKKGMMSPDDVLIILRRAFREDPVVQKIQTKFETVDEKDLVPEIQKDIKIQYLRALLIQSLIGHASDDFVANAESIFLYKHESGLMESSELCKKLKTIAKENAFNHSTVLRAEANGAAAIDELMTVFWDAISNRKDYLTIRSTRMSARAKYVFSLISPNYIEQAVAEPCNASKIAKNMRYRELRLLTDMVSGMTDSFALRIWENIKSVPHVNRP